MTERAILAIDEFISQKRQAAGSDLPRRGAPEGGFTARALGESIFTEGNDLADLHAKVRDAVHCHFDEGKVPKVIRLHFVREEVIRA
jgi:hypothetical protein